MKKNNFKSLAAVLSLAMAATAVPVNVNAAAAPKITVSKKTVYSGKTYSATVKNLKKGYTVQFSSTEGGVNFKKKKVKATGAKVTAKFTVKAAKNIADGSKTKIKAVVKNAKGKKVKTVSQTVTLKQLAKSLTVKDIETTTVKVGDIVNADATISPAAAKGAYKKVFTSSDSSVLKVTNASNGLFEAAAPGKATISVTATNDKGKVVEGSKTIEITVIAAEDTDIKPVEPDKRPDETVTGPAIRTEYQLSLKAGKGEIQADSIDSTDVEVLLQAPTDATINEDMRVAVQLALGTKGVGSLSQEDITLSYSAEKEGWYGVVKFTSATLTAETTSKLTAAVSSVINGPEGVNLIGVSAEPITIKLVPTQAAAVDEVVGAKATKVVVESCDRLTVTFNKAVKKENYMTDDGKAVANGENTQSVTGKKDRPEYFKLWVQNGVNETTSKETSSVKNAVSYGGGTGFTEDQISDIVRVDDYTLTFVLKNDLNQYLKDNSKFLFIFRDTHDGVSEIESNVLEGYISDTKAPSVMAVEATDMRTLKVTFDQPLYSVKKTENKQANATSSSFSENTQKDIIANALSLFNYSVDGQILSREWFRKDANNKDVSSYGTAGSVDIKLEDETKRDTVIITLGKNSAGQRAYFTSGNHVLQVSNVGDYAAVTETGTNNRVTTKNFDFNVKGNDAAPNFTVTIQSPEQYKMTFTTPIAELDDYAIGQEVAPSAIGLDFEYKDAFANDDSVTAMTDFVSALGAYGQKTGLGQTIKVTRIDDDTNGNPQLKVEVTQDWTQLQDYKLKNKTYYNYTLAISCAKEKLTNGANGKINSDLIRRILNTDVITTVDATTPVMQKINEVVAGSEYEVVFSEPVQASNPELTQDYAHAYTPGDNRVGEMTAQIVNNKTKETYDARIAGWGSLEDTSVIVKTNVGLKAGYDYTLYVRGVSDDVGNTSNTLSQTFTVGKEAEDTSFKVLSILADMNYSSTVKFVTSAGIVGYNRTYQASTVDSKDGSKEARTAQWLESDKASNIDADAIYVEFSRNFQTSPIADSVLNTQNWTINGAALPVGSTIISDMNGTDLGTVHRGITIYLPNGTLTDVDATLVKVASNVKDASGNTIAGKTTFTTQSIFKGSYFDGKESVFQVDGNGSIKCLNAVATTIENK